MKQTMVTAILASLAVHLVSGCGTVKNFTGGESGAATPQVYGGVRLDFQTIGGCWAGSGGGEAGAWDRVWQVGVVAPYVALVDLPLSVLADTVTLPLTDDGAGGASAPSRRATPNSTSNTDRASGRVPSGGSGAPSP
jgi:uncharacterized protein YceK